MTLSIFCLEIKWSLWFGTFFEDLSQSENFSEIKPPLEERSTSVYLPVGSSFDLSQ